MTGCARCDRPEVVALLTEFDIPDEARHRRTASNLIDQHGLDRARATLQRIHGRGPVTIGKVRHAWRPSAITTTEETP